MVPFAAGARRRFWTPGATAAWDFEHNQAMAWDGSKFQTYNTVAGFPNFSFTGQNGTYKDVNGILRPAVADQLRLDYSMGWRGALLDQTRANKCEAYAAPTDLTNATKTGDAVATLAVVTDTIELTVAGLNVITGGKVYKLDNSSGATPASVYFSGATGNTNDHTVTAYLRGSGTGQVRLTSAAASDISFSSSYVRSKNVLTPGGSGALLEVEINAGAVVYVSLPQLEGGSFSTSYIPTAGSSVTRDPDDLQIAGLDTAAWFNGGGPGTCLVKYRLAADASTDQVPVLFGKAGVTTDFISHLMDNGSANLISKIRTAGATATMTHSAGAADTDYTNVLAWADNDMGSSVNGAAVVTNTSIVVPTSNITTQFVGNNMVGSGALTGVLRRIVYWPTRIINAEIPALAA